MNYRLPHLLLFVWALTSCKKDVVDAPVPGQPSQPAVQPAQVIVSTLTGDGTRGYRDGPVATAAFSGVGSLAMDNAGVIYASDPGNKAIRKITPAGEVSTVINTTYTPLVVEVSPQGEVYFTTYGPMGISGGVFIKKISASGSVISLPGQAGAHVFSVISDMAFDYRGDLYVTESSWSHLGGIIWKVTPAGEVNFFVGSTTDGHADGVGSAAQFSRIDGITVGAEGTVYVTDFRYIRKISTSGQVTTVAGGAQVGMIDGDASTAQFYQPRGVLADSLNNLYVSMPWSIRKITPTGLVTTIAGPITTVAGIQGITNGSGYVDGIGAAVRFDGYAGAMVGKPSTGIYITDNTRIRKLVIK